MPDAGHYPCRRTTGTAGGAWVTDEERRRRFEAAFRDHYGDVLAYALARADIETAKDATAATFLVAWRRRNELPQQPFPWLLGVTRRTLADQRRTRDRQRLLIRKLASRPEAAEDVADPGAGADARAAVLAAPAGRRLPALPPSRASSQVGSTSPVAAPGGRQG